VALVRTDASEEHIISIKLERISELGTTLIPPTLMMEAIRSSEMAVFTRATRRHVPEDGILHGHLH
jgi:hypothetical protein